jgi:predicted Zn finger-like uncharacterized protein
MMVIQCTQCDTRFKIADEKLKPGGIKVRCSKCRHIFTVMPPEPEKPLPPPEPATEDGIDFGAFNMQPVPEESVPPGAGTEPDRVEEKESEAADSAETDFGAGSATRFPAEFNFEEESPARQGPVEFDFEEKPAAGPAEFDFEEESPSQQGPAEFDFEEKSPSKLETTDLDFREETVTGQGPLEFGFEEEGADDSAEFSFDETDPFPDTETDDTWESETGGGAPDDFDFGDEKDQSAEIDDFDLSGMSFGDEDSLAPSQGKGFGNSPPELAPEIEEKSFAPPPPKKGRAPDGEGKKAAALPVPPRRKSPFKGLLMFVLILLLVLCGVAGYFFWQRGNLDIGKIVEQFTGQGTPPAVAGQIRLSELSSSFVTNREAGQLFVIHGKATNEYPETRSAIAVKGILYNKNGQALLQQTVFCGNPLDAEALRGMPFAKIEENMNNQFGDSLSNLNVGPGKAIPFTIVFKNLPPEIAEYTVETVDSKPGSKP